MFNVSNFKSLIKEIVGCKSNGLIKRKSDVHHARV